MQIPLCEVERAFRKVAAVRAYLKSHALGGLQLELDWRSLAAAIADMYALNISVNEVDAAGGTVAGNVERYADGRAIIMVRSKQTEDMLRYVTVKELCHLMIDEEDDWSNDPLGTIREMKVEYDLLKDNGGGVQDPSRTQMSEFLAMIAATALMYPCEFHEADMEKIAAGEKTIPRIALEHNMPAVAIENAFNHRQVFELYKDEE